MLFAGTAPLTVQNDYVQYGFLGILLAILIWYSRSSYKENIKREENYEIEKKNTIERYEKILDEERDRYHELHIELLLILKSYTHINNA